MVIPYTLSLTSGELKTLLNDRLSSHGQLSGITLPILCANAVDIDLLLSGYSKSPVSLEEPHIRELHKTLKIYGPGARFLSATDFFLISPQWMDGIILPLLYLANCDLLDPNMDCHAHTRHGELGTIFALETNRPVRVGEILCWKYGELTPLNTLIKHGYLDERDAYDGGLDVPDIVLQRAVIPSATGPEIPGGNQVATPLREIVSRKTPDTSRKMMLEVQEGNPDLNILEETRQQSRDLL
tara:strand:+ start:109 stop:831 length:723 start_codon:yes stop_codon:yes gene_type:complete